MASPRAPWRAAVLLPDGSPDALLRVARTPLAHRWARARAGDAVAAAPIFSVADPSPADVLLLLELLADLNLAWLAAHPLPSVLAIRPEPRRDRGDPETWASVPWLLGLGSAPRDCKTLSAWRVAELRLAGEPAGFWVGAGVDRRGDVGYHVGVSRASGVLEDPLRELGG